MRADNDRTVGIEVRRWRLGGQSLLVANIYNAAGQRMYRATHGFFMSPGTLFLHVVRSNLPEEETVMALLEWVVQAVMQLQERTLNTAARFVNAVDFVQV